MLCAFCIILIFSTQRGAMEAQTWFSGTMGCSEISGMVFVLNAAMCCCIVLLARKLNPLFTVSGGGVLARYTRCILELCITFETLLRKSELNVQINWFAFVFFVFRFVAPTSTSSVSVQPLDRFLILISLTLSASDIYPKACHKRMSFVVHMTNMKIKVFT